ncbi:uncharacterized protein LOC119723361 [Patiria miniata]|uniref:Ig-like domain-containing protein n=1 Tax=Patiria miniata TaxID=46514 RepID=A0A913ZDN3_PATMI|nr:uncharacterized protein LOC119723361 [Patiria miniata]
MSMYIETYDADVVSVHPAPCPICGPTSREPYESEPTVDLLEDQSATRGSSVTLGVSYHSTSPVTITWSVDGTVIARQADRISHGQTQLTIRRFDNKHHRKRFSVEVVDRRGRRQGTSCILTMRYC